MNDYEPLDLTGLHNADAGVVATVPPRDPLARRGQGDRAELAATDVVDRQVAGARRVELPVQIHRHHRRLASGGDAGAVHAG